MKTEKNKFSLVVRASARESWNTSEQRVQYVIITSLLFLR